MAYQQKKDMEVRGLKILVTGGAGFIGSNIVETLLQEEASVIVLDDLFTGKLENLPKSQLLVFVKGSVTNRNLVVQLVKKVDIVIHTAARNIIASTKDPRNDYEVNIGGTLNLLLCAREFGIKKFVYTSSCSVYGNSRYLPINEDDATNVLSPYSVSKLAGENYCIAFYESWGVPVSVLRYSNVYGPKQEPGNPYCGVIAKFMQRILDNDPPVIHDDGNQTRDFTYIEDVVEATLLAALSKKAEGEIFNVGTGLETSINDLVSIFGSMVGKKLTPIHIDKRDIDNIRRRVLNIEKIRRKLRWEPKTNLIDGLMKTRKWYENSRKS